MILSLPLHRFTVPQRTMQQEWKALKFCYFLLLLDSVKLNKLLMVFCKTVSFFGRWGFVKRLYLEWFFFFYSPALSDKRWKKKLKKRKKTLDKTNGFVIHSFSLAAHWNSTLQAQWSLRIKGRERRISQRAIIFGKEISVKQRMWEEACMKYLVYFIQYFLFRVNVPKN